MVENNNSQMDYKQIWPDYVYSDRIPDTAPDYHLLPYTEKLNKDGSKYLVFDCQIGEASNDSNRPFLVYVQKLKLIKEFRQKNIFKFDTEDFDEEFLRRVIFPGQTTDRSYAPEFYSNGEQIEYMNLDPKWDLENCRIYTDLDLDELYISCWIYVGSTLADLYMPPFSDKIWLVRDEETGNKAKFKVSEQKSYNLPRTDMEGFVEKDSTLVTHETINAVLNTIGELDGGRYW